MAFHAVFLIIYVIIDSYRTYAKPVVAKGPVSVEIDSQSYAFLREKGYLGGISKGASQLQSEQAIVQALKHFQDFAGIPKTGKLDDLTKEYMVKPRCGMPDMKDGQRRKRKRRYNHQGSKWQDTRLTWAIENSNNDGISDTKVRHILTRAFHKWSTVTNLYFTEFYKRKENTAQIRIRFERGSHGDPYPFDGYGGTLAHAFYPLNNLDLSGDVHFDDDEEFTIKTKAKKTQRKLLWVAVHELGHSIGLEHSPVTGAIMWPYYQNFETPDFDLHYDDIMGIQTLYGGKVSPPRTKAPTYPVTIPVTTPVTYPRIAGCTDKMKAAFIGSNRKLYFINNNKLYMLHDQSQEGIEEGPLPVSSFFKELKNNKIDAIFQDPYYRTHYVFYGDKFSVHNCYKTYCRMRRDGRPRKINDGFQNIKVKLENVDATFIWPKTNSLYIFKGEMFWRLRRVSNSETFAYVAENGYPQNIAAKWHGLPKTVDTVFKWSNNKMYFTKDKLYYRWDARKQAVHSGYPIKLTRSFLNCYANKN